MQRATKNGEFSLIFNQKSNPFLATNAPKDLSVRSTGLRRQSQGVQEWLVRKKSNQIEK